MSSLTATRAFSASKFWLIAAAVLLTIATAASGAVLRSPTAPLVLGGGIAALGVMIASFRRPAWALYAALFVVLLPAGLLPATVQSNLNRGLTVVAFVVWIISVLATRQPVKWTLPASFMAAFVVWASLTLLWADDLSAGFNILQTYALRLILYLILVTNLIRRERDLDTLFHILALSGWLLIGAGLITLATEGYAPGSRLKILDINENQIGTQLLITFAGTLWLSLRSNGATRMLRLCMSALFLTAGLTLAALTGSRGSAISFVIMLAAFWLWRPTRAWAAVGSLLLIAAVVAMPELFATLVARFGGEQGDTLLGGREALWHASLQVIQGHFLGGVGIGREGHAVIPFLQDLRNVSEYDSVSVHSPVLAIFAGTGVVGVALYLGVLLSSLWLFVSQYFRFRRGSQPSLGGYFAIIVSVFLGYMASWFKGGGAQTDYGYFLLLALLIVPSCLNDSSRAGLASGETAAAAPSAIRVREA